MFYKLYFLGRNCLEDMKLAEMNKDQITLSSFDLKYHINEDQNVFIGSLNGWKPSTNSLNEYIKVIKIMLKIYFISNFLFSD